MTVWPVGQDGRYDGEPLIQLAYRSTSTSGADSVLEMSDILAEARSRNAELAITGVLTVVAGTFVQIIEGPAESIERLIVLLKRDRRHMDLSVIERRKVDRRAFGDWDMVSPRLAGLEAAQLSLLLTDDRLGLDDLIPLLTRAIARQDAVLEGGARPLRIQATPPVSPLALARGTDGEA